jgi:hypothetical protein
MTFKPSYSAAKREPEVLDHLPKIRKVGPFSRIRGGIRRLDKRTKAGRYIEAVKATLVQHVGGRPSVTQTVLIERAAILSLRLALMDAQTEPGGAMSEKNAREYLCWSNAHTRLMGLLGPGVSPNAAAPTLADYLRAAQGASDAPSAGGDG